MDHDGRCNGVRIDDTKACEDPDCPLGPVVRPNRAHWAGRRHLDEQT